MDNRYNKLLSVISTSMTAIEEKYFNFKVAGQFDPTLRERAYCAELYHQIRDRQQEIPEDYTINSEPNKRSHPIVEDKCGPVDPDIIVHHTGYMGPEDNLAVIEVKTSNGDLTNGINKDLQTINCMTTIENGYYGGIIIVFGELTELKRRNLIRRIENNKSPNVSRLTLCLQHAAGTQPQLIEF